MFFQTSFCGHRTNNSHVRPREPHLPRPVPYRNTSPYGPSRDLRWGGDGEPSVTGTVLQRSEETPIQKLRLVPLTLRTDWTQSCRTQWLTSTLLKHLTLHDRCVHPFHSDRTSRDDGTVTDPKPEEKTSCDSVRTDHVVCPHSGSLTHLPLILFLVLVGRTRLYVRLIWCRPIPRLSPWLGGSTTSTPRVSTTPSRTPLWRPENSSVVRPEFSRPNSGSRTDLERQEK